VPSVSRLFCCFGLVLLCAGQAWGETSATVSALSDDRYRGYTLSGSRPTVQAGVGYDDDSGWYAGGLLARDWFAADSGWELRTLANLGYARRLDSGLTLEGGANQVGYTNSHDYNYHEFYAGLGLGDLVARLYYSPNYYQRGQASLYGELNASRQLGERWSLQAHLGLLALDPFVVSAGQVRSTRCDVRVGLGYALPDAMLNLAWTDSARSPVPADPTGLASPGSAVQLTVVHAF